MRIAHITDVYLPRVGGIERQVHQLAVRQAAAGHDVHVVTTTPGQEDSDGAVQVHRIGSTRWPHLGSALPHVWWALHGVLADLDPDVVHIHASVASPLALIAGLSATPRQARPTVVTVHSMWAHLARPYRALFQVTGLARRPIAWTAVSRAAAEQVQVALGPGREVDVVPNGIDPEDWRGVPIREGSAVHVVAVLRLAARKRPLAMLEALRHARAALPASVGLKVSVVGDGRLRGAATRYLSRHGMAWVRLLGNRTSEQVRDLLHQADLFVAPARLESFGIAALEARCAGVPVVALEGTGVGDFVKHGREGLLVGSDEDLAAAIVRLAGSPEARATMSAHNRRTPPPVSWSHTLLATERAYARAAELSGVAQVSAAASA